MFFSIGFFHWFLQRTTAIVLLFLLFFIIFFDIVLLNSFLFVCLSLHLKLGLENLINDYCHDHILKSLIMCQMRLIYIYILQFLIFVF